MPATKGSKKSTRKSASQSARGASGKKSAKSARSGAKKGTAKKATARKGSSKKQSGSKRKLNAALMQPMQPSAELAAIVGDRPLPRTQVTKKVWDYIKGHKLQDSVNRRMINADENLKRVFGGKKQVSMFEMTKLVNQHLK